MYLNLMSFNIQHGRDFSSGNINLELMSDTIKKCGGQIIGLNEVRDNGLGPEYKAQAKIIAKQLGYNYYFAKAVDFDAGPYGNALISEYPIIKADTYLIEDPPVKDEDVYYETRCILKAIIDIPILNNDLTVFVSHFGLAKAEQRNGIEKIIKLIRLTKGPYIFMGDLNMQPNNEIIKPLFEAMKDTASAFETAKLSFPSDKPSKKIDYIFTDKTIKICSADIPAIIASDHRPLMATIKV